jgi:hypothetical protein
MPFTVLELPDVLVSIGVRPRALTVRKAINYFTDICPASVLEGLAIGIRTHE